MRSAGMISASSAGIEGATATMREPSTRISPQEVANLRIEGQDGRAVNEDPLHGPHHSLMRRPA